jgi:hypothetical protein
MCRKLAGVTYRLSLLQRLVSRGPRPVAGQATVQPKSIGQVLPVRCQATRGKREAKRVEEAQAIVGIAAKSGRLLPAFFRSPCFRLPLKKWERQRDTAIFFGVSQP